MFTSFTTTPWTKNGDVIVRCAQRGIVPAINPDEFHIPTKDMENSCALWNEIDFKIALFF